MTTALVRFSLAVGLAVGLTVLVTAPRPFFDRIASAHARAGTFVIADVRVFDGERARPGMNVVIEDGAVRAIDGSSDKWRDRPTIDGRGATLLPGLIDAHTHPDNPAALQESLRFGVTTALGMGVTATADEGALRAAAAGRVDVADYRSAGTPATAPDAHGTFGRATTVAGPADAEAFVDARKSGGSDYLKILLNGVRTARDGTPNLNAETVKALVRAAHAREMLVVAHVESLGDVDVALDSGVDGLAHLWREDGPSEPIIQRLVAQRMFVVPTIVIPDAMIAGSGAALVSDARLQPFLAAAVVERLSRPPRIALRARDIAWRLDTIGRLRTAGVRLLAGTDADDGTRTSSGVHLHRELELLVRAGLTPSQAISAATAAAADAFRLADRGRIAAGLRADLVLVRGDPTVDVTATRDILRVWRAGVEFDRRSR
jgi:imidazolonepropionase-like amidohydrolase